MARAPKSDSGIDRLYQLPLGEFIAARNTLAKETGDAGIKTLQKPSLPAWAVNQLYWRHRSVYDEVTGRAEDLRATHMATERGKRADLRGASKDHEQAVDAALKATLALLAEEGQPITDATKQAVATTLRGLPGDEPPGRLTRPLEPRGFDMLAAAAAAGGGKVKAAAPAAKAPVVAMPAAGNPKKDAEERAANANGSPRRVRRSQLPAVRHASPSRQRDARSSRPRARHATPTKRSSASRTPRPWSKRRRRHWPRGARGRRYGQGARHRQRAREARPRGAGRDAETGREGAPTGRILTTEDY